MRFSLLLITLIFISIPIKAQNTVVDSVLATVNSTPITRNEFKLFKQKLKSSVFQELQSNQIPLTSDSLKQRILKKAVEIKIQQLLAQQLGLIQDISYKNFYTEFQIENQRRADAIAKKQVIYGPVQFSEINYFDYHFSELILKIKKELSKSTLQLSDNQILAIYESKKNDLFKLNDYFLIQRFDIKFKKLNDSAQISTEIQRFKTDISKNPVVNSAIYKHLVLKSDTLVINPLKYQTLEGENEAELLKIVGELKAGEIKTVENQPGRTEIYKILERKPMGFQSFESVKSSLKRTETDRLYTKYIKNLCSKAIIEQF